MQWQSNKKRPVSQGFFPLHKLARTQTADLDSCPAFAGLSYAGIDDPEQSILPAMREFQAMLDTIRAGNANPAPGEIPTDPVERSNHLKSFAYFNDAGMTGVCEIPTSARLAKSISNPDVAVLSKRIQTEQTKTLAAGIDMIMADLKAAVSTRHGDIDDHSHALVILNVHPRTPATDEDGCEWLHGADAHRSALLASENAVILAEYLRKLGFAARAHTACSSDLDLNQLGIAAGLILASNGTLQNPLIGEAFSVAAVSTNLSLQADLPLDPDCQYADSFRWRIGMDSVRRKACARAFSKRRFVDGEHAFETLKRVDQPTTFIDEPRVPRVPKRTDMFARAQFGDMGKLVQQNATNGHYARKAAPSTAQRRALGAMILLQDGESSAKKPGTRNPEKDAQRIKAMCYYLGADATGISRCPDWTWYSHDAAGKPIDPPHDQAISLVIDQGFDTMEGASGDDWISVSQSMRAYLRFALVGSVIAKQIRLLGYKAKSHTVLDGEVLQPPLLLLSGLGEVSRIGEVILNPFLGPRLKSGVITTDLPLAHDQPIDFGLQTFCEGCNKCARECPSGAITAGPKTMFNGYEIYKSDSQKCATYRITTEGGAMCGRCMKTCPWNLEGIFSEKPFRTAAMRLPAMAPMLAKLDDAVGRGTINPIKKWWWDIELKSDGGYKPVEKPVNVRGLQPKLKLRYEDQTLAVYPAPLAAHPYPYPDPMDREKGIDAYNAMLSPAEHKKRLAAGEFDNLVPPLKPANDAPVQAMTVTNAIPRGEGVVHYILQRADGDDLPEWTAGAHIDVVVAPEFLREYSMLGDPAVRDRYEIAVLAEEQGRGGSKLLQRIFSPGRRVFISNPVNHFALDVDATHCILMGGGIGITPMIAMANELHRANRSFSLHYSAPVRARAGFTDYLQQQPWADKINIHISAENTRADLQSILSNHAVGTHVYTCGPDRYMDAIFTTAQHAGINEDNLHREYFSVPEEPEYINHPFKLHLTNRDLWIDVSADEAATDALQRNGITIDVKCSDGLCGVCMCDYTAGEIEHRDHVLSRKQRESKLILCRSRAAKADGTIELSL